MADRRRRGLEGLLITAGLGYFAAQLYHTWVDRNRWPLCSYNMFNRCLPEQLAQPRITLYDSIGEHPMLPVYGTLPLEFFRVVRIFAKVYLTDTSDDLRNRFAERVIDRLNREPWDAFDEVHASFRPRGDTGFTGFDLYEVWIDTRDFDPRADAPLHRPRLLYSYRRKDAASAA
jgi:hypothetical protein